MRGQYLCNLLDPKEIRALINGFGIHAKGYITIHNGYIPWANDLTIGLSDFNKLVLVKGFFYHVRVCLSDCDGGGSLNHNNRLCKNYSREMIRIFDC